MRSSPAGICPGRDCQCAHVRQEGSDRGYAAVFICQYCDGEWVWVDGRWISEYQPVIPLNGSEH